MTALGDAVTKAYERGYAAGWYAAQLEQAREQERSQPADFPLDRGGETVPSMSEIERLLRDAEAALREAEVLLEHANLRWDGWRVADRIAAHIGRRPGRNTQV